MTFNQRSVTEILEMILTIGRIVGTEERALTLVSTLQSELSGIRASAARFPHRPRVLFEEWYDPLISGIRWVDELIEAAGGNCSFPELRKQQAAKDRIINPADVIERDPEVIIGSWCGRAVKKDWIRSRPGWDRISAVRNNHIYEVKSAFILQPGPAALTEGIRQLHAILGHSMNQEIDEGLLPKEKSDAALGVAPRDKRMGQVVVNGTGV